MNSLFDMMGEGALSPWYMQGGGPLTYRPSLDWFVYGDQGMGGMTPPPAPNAPPMAPTAPAPGVMLPPPMEPPMLPPTTRFNHPPITDPIIPLRPPGLLNPPVVPLPPAPNPPDNPVLRQQMGRGGGKQSGGGTGNAGWRSPDYGRPKMSTPPAQAAPQQNQWGPPPPMSKINLSPPQMPGMNAGLLNNNSGWKGWG